VFVTSFVPLCWLCARCAGSKSELTFFGRALFDEQLRKTLSFEQAFASAGPIIQQREIDAKKDDGFSNPQIAVGKDIRPVLATLARELMVLAGEEYGTGSSRDWAAKGTLLLGIKAVVAKSFERIHRSNLVGMGVLPLQFKDGDSWEALGLDGSEVIDVLPDAALTPQSEATLVIHRADGTEQRVVTTLRIDTPIEVDYYRAGGILPYVLRQLLSDAP
jgi:hypothetical protein